MKFPATVTCRGKTIVMNKLEYFLLCFDNTYHCLQNCSEDQSELYCGAIEQFFCMLEDLG
jgi:hypothetical protein